MLCFQPNKDRINSSSMSETLHSYLGFILCAEKALFNISLDSLSTNLFFGQSHCCCSSMSPLFDTWIQRCLLISHWQSRVQISHHLKETEITKNLLIWEKIFVWENLSLWLFKISTGMCDENLRSMACSACHCWNGMTSQFCCHSNWKGYILMAW